MKKIVKHIRIFLAAALAMVALHGCEIAGLDLQEPFEYDYEVGMKSNELNMTAWEFIVSRPDLFSHLKAGIEYAGLQNMYSTSQNCTYLLLSNRAFSSAVLADSSFFTKNQINAVTPDSLNDYSVEVVKELLMYHIVKDIYSWDNLPAYLTWYDTYGTGPSAKIGMYLSKERNPGIVMNGYVGHYNINIKPRTSNLKTKDGSIIHVMDSWMRMPTVAQLEQ